MSITPVGGWTQRASFSDVTDSPQPSKDHCPNCQSDEWRAASLVYQEGLSVTRSRTRGTAVGIGRVGVRGGKFVVAGGTYQNRTKGSSQTMLSALAAPPRRRTGLLVFLGLTSSLFFILAAASLQSSEYPKALFCLLMALIFAVILIFSYSRQRDLYEAAVEIYGDMRICQRCGTFYTGSSSSLVEPTVDSNTDARWQWLLGIGVLVVIVYLAFVVLQTSEAPAVIVDGPAYLTSTRPSSRASSSRSPRTQNEGLPNYVANALRTPNLAPTEVSPNERKIALGTDGKEQFIPTLEPDACGSGGCNWEIVDPVTEQVIFPLSSGLLYKTNRLTNGFYDAVVVGGTAAEERLYVYEYRNGKYENISCYERIIDPVAQTGFISC